MSEGEIFCAATHSVVCVLNSGGIDLVTNTAIPCQSMPVANDYTSPLIH